jgi:hypothetical protein
MMKIRSNETNTDNQHTLSYNDIIQIIRNFQNERFLSNETEREYIVCECLIDYFNKLYSENS